MTENKHCIGCNMVYVAKEDRHYLIEDYRRMYTEMPTSGVHENDICILLTADKMAGRSAETFEILVEDMQRAMPLKHEEFKQDFEIVK